MSFVPNGFPVQDFGTWGEEGSLTYQPMNRFNNLESLEDRIIFYLLSPKGKTDLQLVQVYNLWKCLYYPTTDALLQPLPEFTDVMKLLSNGQAGQDDKRIFRSPYMDDAWKEECAMLKIYVDSIIPRTAYYSQVNVGVDCVCHNKIVNVTVPEKDESTFIAEVDGVKYYVETKSRISIMVKAVLSLLNGADIQGVGQMQFNYEQFMYNESRYALWNNRNFEGHKIVIGCTVGGVE